MLDGVEGNDLYQERLVEFKKKMSKIIKKKTKRAGNYHERTHVVGPNNLRGMILDAFEQGYFMDSELR